MLRPSNCRLTFIILFAFVTLSACAPAPTAPTPPAALPTSATMATLAPAPTATATLIPALTPTATATATFTETPTPTKVATATPTIPETAIIVEGITGVDKGTTLYVVKDPATQQPKVEGNFVFSRWQGADGKWYEGYVPVPADFSPDKTTSFSLKNGASAATTIDFLKSLPAMPNQDAEKKRKIDRTKCWSISETKTT